MIKAAVDIGFNESEAELLLNQIFMGSVAIEDSYSLFNKEWIAKLVSKGLATERTLKVFEEWNL